MDNSGRAKGYGRLRLRYDFNFSRDTDKTMEPLRPKRKSEVGRDGKVPMKAARKFLRLPHFFDKGLQNVLDGSDSGPVISQQLEVPRVIRLRNRTPHQRGWVCEEEPGADFGVEDNYSPDALVQIHRDLGIPQRSDCEFR